MESQRALVRLVEHQTRIAALLDEAGGLLRGDFSFSGGPMAGLRWQMMRAMREYQLFKHQEIFDPLSRSTDRTIAAQADKMKARCLNLGSRYLAHVERWGGGATSAAWTAYTDDALAIVTAIRRHLDRELLEAQTLLRGTDRTRRSASHP